MSITIKCQLRKNRQMLPYLYRSCPSSRLILERVEKLLHGLVDDELFSTLQYLSHRQNAGRLSLFYRYFYDTCSDDLPLVSPVQTSQQAPTMPCIQDQLILCIPLLRMKFQSISFLELSREDAYPITTILTSKRLESTFVSYISS